MAACPPASARSGSATPSRRWPRTWAGRARQGPRHPARAHLPALRGPPAARGLPGHRQDHAGPGAGRHRRGRRTRASSSPPTCCPATSPASRSTTRSKRHLRLPPRADLPRHRARRRDQPGLAEDPVGAAGGDGGGPRHRGRRHPRRPAPVHGDRHPEPHRAGGHLPAARGPARPVPDEDVGRLPRRRGHRGAAPRLAGPRPGRAGRAGDRQHRADRRDEPRRRRGARRPRRRPLRPPSSPRRRASIEHVQLGLSAARLPRPGPGRPRPGPPRPAAPRRTRGRRRAGPAGAVPPAAARRRGPVQRRHRRQRRSSSCSTRSRVPAVRA